jgi:hypothetical protein
VHFKSNEGKTGQWNGQPELCGCKNGNGGVAQLSAELHAMGFGFGSYAGSGGLCQVEACDIPSLNASKFKGKQCKHGFDEPRFLLCLHCFELF